MAISQSVVVGEEFTVAFSGGLRNTRGGYLVVKAGDGAEVALLRSDGNSDIPIGYELDVTVATMLTDALHGDTSTFIFPAELPAGPYTLCTALGDEECVSVEVGGA